MAEPAELLQQARQSFDRSCLVSGETVDGLNFSQLRHSVERILQYLEQRHAAASGPAKTPEQLRVASTLQQYTSGTDDAAVAAQRELSKMAGQFKSFDLDLEATRRGKTDAAVPDVLDLDALQRLCDAATPGPWHINNRTYIDNGDGELLADVGRADDAAFLTAARDALPKLIARVRELSAELDYYRAEAGKDDHG